MSASSNAVPATPQVIPPGESDARDGYLAPTTRSAERRQGNMEAPEDSIGSEATPESSARPRRSTRRSQPMIPASPPRLSTRSSQPMIPDSPSRRSTRRSHPMIPASPPSVNGSAANGFLSPTRIPDALHDLSRSSSPLGLIPLHLQYRNFIHRHEIPRKLLHVSIGFLTLDLYRRGIQTLQITPVLFTVLVPIASTDLIRHRSERVNRFYTRCLGALMRETEVSGYNGVIWYLLGTYTVLRFFPKDVGVMGVLLLSWCDPAASTFGRLYGRYTPHLRPGKSLAGTLAAWTVGVATAAAFWGWFVPYIGPFPNDPEHAFMFTGHLKLVPDCVRGLLGWSGESSATTITGPLALGVMSVVSGFVAAGSELIDLWSWDDNFTIPVLSGLGLWGFLKIFG